MASLAGGSVAVRFALHSVPAASLGVDDPAVRVRLAAEHRVALGEDRAWSAIQSHERGSTL